ncbi:MAG: FkbM family methyltransferase [Snowella sp.]|nr:FkbM family methyltransferase [Snowella sp.]
MTTLRRRLSRFRRRCLESIGVDYYSRPAIEQMDLKLLPYLPYPKGFYIEVGANNGYQYSNTYYLAKLRQWRGILIEPIPEIYDECVRERPESIVLNCALVSEDYPHSTVTMKYANMMSLGSGLSRKNEQEEDEHIAQGMIWETKHTSTYQIDVPCRTLTSILDEYKIQEIDLFSLDVEGAELTVLKGLDFSQYRPKFILIETEQKAEIDEYLTPYYQEVEQFTFHDYLYRSRQTPLIIPS